MTMFIIYIINNNSIDFIFTSILIDNFSTIHYNCLYKEKVRYKHLVFIQVKIIIVVIIN